MLIHFTVINEAIVYIYIFLHLALVKADKIFNVIYNVFYQLSIQDVYRLYQSSRQLGACANPAKIVLQVSAN